jgi:carbamoyltransferase
MAILGISGGPHMLDEDLRLFPHIDGYWHDAAAVLVEKGEIVVAHEEERLSRTKHTTAFPTHAVKACLNEIPNPIDLECVSVYFTEAYWEHFLTEWMLYFPSARRHTARSIISLRIREATGRDFDQEKLSFVRHHRAHAMAAWEGSGFTDTLVLTLDGAGDAESGSVSSAHDGVLNELWTFPTKQSLGGLYLWTTRFLGYRQFDEYKVMGLAGQGDARMLRDRLAIVQLLPEGAYKIDWQFVHRLNKLATPRRCDEEITEFHADLAATVQEALEEAVLHILRDARKRTGHRRLCFAGGVAHNCSLNGKIAESEQFREIFVHPASHDAGCALGAALEINAQKDRRSESRKLMTVFWGTDLSAQEIRETIERWRRWLIVSREKDVIEWAAERLDNGAILAWAHGKAEFGPRALGHRSLLADPRPLANKARINSIIKKREQYRPFAPVVQVEHASTFFDTPPGIDCSFMSFAVPVQIAWRAQLAAITHSDSTARLQTISKEQDLLLWNLLDRFGMRTGIPILLNTSLNVASEPIVDSVEDIIVFVLTTAVDAAVIGDFVITRPQTSEWTSLNLSLPDGVQMSQSAVTWAGDRVWRLERGGPDRTGMTISKDIVELLRFADGNKTVQALIAPVAGTDEHHLASEVFDLWTKRLVRLAPPRN